MKPTKVFALILAGMALVGMTYASAGQRALAHNFSEDESATFLVDIMAAKVHLIVVGWNLNNPDAALGHLEHVNMIFDDWMLNEIAERNERIARDIPVALDDLASMIGDGADRSVIAGQVSDIRNLLDEAVSVRIDRNHLEDPQIKALIVAGLTDNVLIWYEHAYGMESSEHGHNGESDHNGESSHDEHGEIEDHQAYVAARIFATLAKTTFLKDQLVNEGSDEAHDAQSALFELRDAMYAKRSLEDVTVLVHLGVHENLRMAFGLELADHDHPGDEHHNNNDDHADDEHHEDEHTAEDEHGNEEHN